MSAARASASRLQTQSSSRWLVALPLFHVGGLAMLFRCIADGSTLILQERFEEDAFAGALEEEAVTHTSLVAVTLERLLKRKAFTHAALEVVLVGAGPTPMGLVDEARRAGFPVRLTYGLTEASSQVATQTSAEGYACGPVLDGLQMRLANDGEIELKGPSLLLCYLHDEAATSASHSEGWFRTGDFGALDERGNLTVLGRRNDLLISGGENVYPAEIEAALMAHPAIKDAGVVPLDDVRWGQVPLALVVTKDGTLDEPGLKEWCRNRLATYKIPAHFQPVAELPRNAMGKLDRRALCATPWATEPLGSAEELIRTERAHR
jgi:O-succinylbenzoic acid--CoA ligase